MYPTRRNRILGGIAVAAVASFAQAGTLYVDDDAPLGGDGLGWPTAYRYLQDALADAEASGGAVTEILVAQGTYRPDTDEAGNVTPLDRQATFQLLSGVSLLGGYAGLGAPEPDARDIGLRVTTLSGDLSNDDPDPPHDFGSYSDNSWHVVTGSGVDATALIEGFTITAGYANGPEYPASFDAMGAGMLVVTGSPTVQACTFAWNLVIDNGAGMANLEDSSPVISGCTFEYNATDELPPSGGAGIVNGLGGLPRVIGCTFRSNWAVYGGGVQNVQSSPRITDCSFIDNTAHTSGGGMQSIAGSSPVVINCRMTGNSAAWGGALANNDLSDTTLINCLLSGNTATDGGGAAHTTDGSAVLINCTVMENQAALPGSGIQNAGGHSIVVNSVLWNSGVDIWNVDGGSASVSYSDVEGGYIGVGNINVDPQCRDLANGDMRLASGSPCIDAGDNTALPADEWDLDGDGDTMEPIPLDLAGLPRFVDDLEAIDGGNPDGVRSIVDMGAYEFCRGDVMADGVVDVNDLIVVIMAWGTNDSEADTNADGVVDVNDLNAVIVGWGACS